MLVRLDTEKSSACVASVCNAHEGDPQQEDTTRRLFDQGQEYLTEIAGVPWIIAGKWNMGPQEADAQWDRRHARLHDIGAAAQKQGRSIDWLIGGLRAPTWGVEACVIAGTDHVGVHVRLDAVDASTLGVRMEQPAQISISTEDLEEVERLRGCVARSLGAPPRDLGCMDERS